MQLTRRRRLGGERHQGSKFGDHEDGADTQQNKEDHDVVGHEARGKAARLLGSSRSNFCDKGQGMEERKTRQLKCGEAKRVS